MSSFVWLLVWRFHEIKSACLFLTDAHHFSSQTKLNWINCSRVPPYQCFEMSIVSQHCFTRSNRCFFCLFPPSVDFGWTQPTTPILKKTLQLHHKLTSVSICLYWNCGSFVCIFTSCFMVEKKQQTMKEPFMKCFKRKYILKFQLLQSQINIPFYKVIQYVVRCLMGKYLVFNSRNVCVNCDLFMVLIICKTRIILMYADCFTGCDNN